MTELASYPLSTVPYTIQYLTTAFQTQLSTDPNPENITLFVGNDPGLLDTPDLVGIVNVSRNLEHFAMVGSGQNLAMYEKYSVYVKISSAMRAASQLEASSYLTTRVWQLLGYLEYAVRLDPSLDFSGPPDNGGVMLTAWPGQTQGGLIVVAPDMNGWLCEMTWKVDCEATQ